MRDASGHDLATESVREIHGHAAAPTYGRRYSGINVLMLWAAAVEHGYAGRRIHGISFKVLAMALAELLLAGDPGRERWVAAGAVMIAVDTLVHNWLHRTGIARERGTEHPYGRLCYEPGGCAEVLERCSREIDARALCPEGPIYFPRLVQHAVWRFCAEGGLNICNGNRINDRIGCLQFACSLSTRCARLPPL